MDITNLAKPLCELLKQAWGRRTRAKDTDTIDLRRPRLGGNDVGAGDDGGDRGHKESASLYQGDTVLYSRPEAQLITVGRDSWASAYGIARTVANRCHNEAAAVHVGTVGAP